MSPFDKVSLPALAATFDVTPSKAAQDRSFALHQGDRVVFYGDSITEQRFYTRWTELYVTTRFPRMQVQFREAGVGGDCVTGGSGGPIDTRLSRDVFRHKPTVVTIMLGMNDGRYAPLTDEIDCTYATGYEHILKSIREHAPAARILAVAPSPYDNVTRSQDYIPGGYNATLVHFGQVAAVLAKKYGAAFADANQPFVKALQTAYDENKFASQLLIPDRVHPEQPAQILIAMAILRAWNAPSIVSATNIDAAAANASGSSGVSITGLHKDSGGLTWTSSEEALPLPLDSNNAALEYMKRFSNVMAEFNQEPLVVANLTPGRYSLFIDDANLGIFDSASFAQGINLAEMNTPMQQQAQDLEWKIRDKGDLQAARTRILIHDFSPSAEAALTEAETGMQQMIWDHAAPKPHQFRLVPVAEQI